MVFATEYASSSYASIELSVTHAHTHTEFLAGGLAEFSYFTILYDQLNSKGRKIVRRFKFLKRAQSRTTFPESDTDSSLSTQALRENLRGGEEKKGGKKKRCYNVFNTSEPVNGFYCYDKIEFGGGSAEGRDTVG